jgi:AraC-like DNA-binding protein
LMACFAGLVAGKGQPDARALETEELARKLRDARNAERMWILARDLIDESRGRNFGDHGSGSLWTMGIGRVPDHALVGLFESRTQDPDPVDDTIRRDAFQRACTELARGFGEVVCGQVGNHGVSFLLNHAGPEGRTRAALSDLATRATTLGKRHGFRLHLGVNRYDDEPGLPARYRKAFGAAEKALSQGIGLVFGDPTTTGSREILRELRAELGQALASRPGLLTPRFDRYIDAVLAHSSYRFERVRSELVAGLERLAEPLISSGYLSKKNYDELVTTAEQSAEAARTVAELVALYRSLVSDIEKALSNPTLARQDRSTRRAITFMNEHLSERLTLKLVARAAGFAPDYFSRIFKREEGKNFEDYLRALRIERARQLLATTDLSVEHVGSLSGFRDRRYFYRVFKRATGTTPQMYRAQT